MRNEGEYLGLVMGILLIINSWLTWIADGGVFIGVPSPSWLTWPLLFFGIIVLVISIRGLLRKETKQQIDHEAAEAKSKMDQMYFNEYGVWPDYKEETEVLPENQAESGQPNTGTEAGNANLKPTAPSETKPPAP